MVWIDGGCSMVWMVIYSYTAHQKIIERLISGLGW